MGCLVFSSMNEYQGRVQGSKCLSRLEPNPTGLAASLATKDKRILLPLVPSNSAGGGKQSSCSGVTKDLPEDLIQQASATEAQ